MDVEEVFLKDEKKQGCDMDHNLVSSHQSPQKTPFRRCLPAQSRSNWQDGENFVDEEGSLFEYNSGQETKGFIRKTGGA